MATRARDLRDNIATMGFERGMVHTLELLLEELVGLRQAVVEQAQLQNQLIDVVETTVNAAGSMQTTIDHLKKNEIERKEQQYDDAKE